MNQILFGALVILSLATAAGVARVALRFSRHKPPRFRNFKEYVMHIFGLYPPDVDREAGERFVRFQMVVTVVAFVVILSLLLSLVSWLSL